MKSIQIQWGTKISINVNGVDQASSSAGFKWMQQMIRGSSIHGKISAPANCGAAKRLGQGETITSVCHCVKFCRDISRDGTSNTLTSLGSWLGAAPWLRWRWRDMKWSKQPRHRAQQFPPQLVRVGVLSPARVFGSQRVELLNFYIDSFLFSALTILSKSWYWTLSLVMDFGPVQASQFQLKWRQLV